VFRRRDSARADAGSAANALLRRGRDASRVGDLAAAVDARAAAAALLRELADEEALGRALYDLAGSLIDAGRPAEAIAVLDEAEEACGRGPEERIADVQARRAIAYGLTGAGASAVVDAQSALLAHRDGGDGAGGRGLARVLAVNADVLAAYGDPDLAVASADLAIRLFLTGTGAGARGGTGRAGARARAGARDRTRDGTRAGARARGATGARAGAARADDGDRATELRRAAAVAIAVHTAHGRTGLADQAATVARRSGGLAGVATVLARRQRSAHPPVLAVTVATALDAARQRLDRQPPRIGDRAVVRPAVDVELLTPLDRVLVPLGPGGRSADAAARLGGTLAGIALELLPLDADRGVRLGLEAHALLAGASRLESEALRHQLPRLGPTWAAVLVACSRRAEADRDPALAMDLAAWAGGVAEQLFPATLVDRGARAVAVDVLDHHGRLLALRGEEAQARDAVSAADRLRVLP
jgi:tetratricopeptide (TPR) repeat protein